MQLEQSQYKIIKNKKNKFSYLFMSFDRPSVGSPLEDPSSLKISSLTLGTIHKNPPPPQTSANEGDNSATKNEPPSSCQANDECSKN